MKATKAASTLSSMVVVGWLLLKARSTELLLQQRGCCHMQLSTSELSADNTSKISASVKFTARSTSANMAHVAGTNGAGHGTSVQPATTLQQTTTLPSHDQLLAAANPQLLFELSVLYYKQHLADLEYDTKTSLSALYKQATLGP